jgi:hypothetical protein
MPDIEDPKASEAATGEPEATGTPSETEDPTGKDVEQAPTNPDTAGAPDQAEQPLPDPFFWPDERNAASAELGATSTPASEREEIDELMARAMRWRAVEANKIITEPADIQRFVDRCWVEELPAAQAAHAALEAAGYIIVRDNR